MVILFAAVHVCANKHVVTLCYPIKMIKAAEEIPCKTKLPISSMFLSFLNTVYRDDAVPEVVTKCPPNTSDIPPVYRTKLCESFNITGLITGKVL